MLHPLALKAEQHTLVIKKNYLTHFYLPYLMFNDFKNMEMGRQMPSPLLLEWGYVIRSLVKEYPFWEIHKVILPILLGSKIAVTFGKKCSFCFGTHTTWVI